MHLRNYQLRMTKILQSICFLKISSENEAVFMAAESSFRNRLAFGENTGKYVTKIGSGFGYEEEVPFAKGRLCRTIHGFSLLSVPSRVRKGFFAC